MGAKFRSRTLSTEGQSAGRAAGRVSSTTPRQRRNMGGGFWESKAGGLQGFTQTLGRYTLSSGPLRCMRFS